MARPFRVAILAATLAGLMLSASSERLDAGLKIEETHPADKAALLGMLSALGLQDSPLNWTASIDPCGKSTCTPSADGSERCNWGGISCRDYRVHTIDLSGHALEGHVGGYLCGFTALERLDLSHNRLTGVSDGCMSLPALKAVDLSHNMFTGYLPFATVSMPKLAMLNLSHNGFADYIPNSWGNLTSLEVIDISYNDITGTVPDPIMDLQSLHVMILDHNCRICGQLPKSFARRVDLSTTGTNIGAWMCWSNSDVCRESTSLLIAQIGVSVSAIFCFLGVCTLYTKFRRRCRNEPHVPEARLPKVKSAPNIMECVASLVVMPSEDSQVVVAFPICQELPLFRRNPILEAMRKQQELDDVPATTMQAPVAAGIEINGNASQEAVNEEVRIPIGADVNEPESVVALVRMPSITSSEDSQDIAREVRADSTDENANASNAASILRSRQDAE